MDLTNTIHNQQIRHTVKIIKKKKNTTQITKHKNYKAQWTDGVGVEEERRESKMQKRRVLSLMVSVFVLRVIFGGA